jgi:hypothetical protein
MKWEAGASFSHLERILMATHDREPSLDRGHKRDSDPIRRITHILLLVLLSPALLLTLAVGGIVALIGAIVRLGSRIGDVAWRPAVRGGIQAAAIAHSGARGRDD